MNIYIIETVNHLFLALIVVKNNNHNVLIVDSHRYHTLIAVKKFEFIISKKFKKTIFVHKYKQRGTFSNRQLLKQITYYMRLNCDVKKILKETKTTEHKNLYIFTTNRIERILINKIHRTESRDNIFLIEEGLGSYTNIQNILGKDTPIFNRKNTLHKVLRKLSNTSVNIPQFKELYFVFPDLVDRSISSSFKVIKELPEGNSVLEIKQIFSEYYFKDHELKYNISNSLHLFANSNDEFEKKINLQFFSKYQIEYKMHPGKIENYDSYNSLLNISIEMLSLVDPFSVLISYASGTAITLLHLDPRFTSKFIFLFEVYHSYNVRFESDNTLSFFYRLKQKFPERIFIPTNLNELLFLLDKECSLA